VVGAGVIGLSVAIRLGEAGCLVEVLARELPLETTSARAAAIWYPYLIEPQDRTLGWAGASLAEFAALAEDPATGVVLRPGVELLREPLPTPWWAVLVPSLRTVSDVPPGYESGWSCVLPVIEMPVYLRWLQARLEALGGSVRRVELAGLPSDDRIVVNCSGLGARALVGDRTIRPVRGQTLRLAQVGVESWLLDESALTYVIPRAHDIVVGGTEDEGRWDTTPDMTVAAHLLAKAIAVEPRLAAAEILSHQVGLRPARPEVRLEVEQQAADRPIVHCYGHGGAGVTVSWGCADEVVRLLRESTSR
jgi:D-amino-acid oxidase